jgi:hypothetical protein
MHDAAIGFRSKTGRAIAAVIAGTELIWSGEVSLLDDAYPFDEGPYHPFLEIPWSDALKKVKPVVTAIEKQAIEVVRTIGADMLARNACIRAVGVVGSPPRDIERIGNRHMRAHAAEGILFRRVLENAAKKLRIRCVAFSDRELVPSPLMKKMGRADVRLAATAAWLALTSQ